MRHIFSKKSVLSCCATALLCFSTYFSSFANISGNWVHHGGAALSTLNKESRVCRIIDGNRYVYMLVRGISFNKSKGSYFHNSNGIDPLQLFCYDKNSEWTTENLKFLPNAFPVNGGAVKLIEYSPTYGMLVVVYNDNKIDLISDSGEVTPVNVFSGGAGFSSLPTVVYSVTFDREKPLCYVATSFGYAAVNLNDGNSERVVTTDRGVAWATRVGNRMVLLAGDEISQSAYSTLAYSVGTNETNIRLDGREIKLGSILPNSKMNSDLTLPNLQALVPLEGDTFAAIAEKSADTNFSLITVTFEGDVVNGTELVTSGTFDNASIGQFRNFFRTDGRYWLTEDGFGVSDSNNVYLVAADGSLQTLSKSAIKATEKAAKTSTADCRRFWFHTYDDNVLERGLYYRDFDGATWSDASEIIRPFGATTSLPIYISYSPHYGMLFRGPGAFRKNNECEKDMICSYKDGKWTNLSFSATDKSNFWALSESTRHIGPDPVNPSWIWNASYFGLTRMNPDDYSDLLVYTTESRKGLEGTYKGMFAVLSNPNYRDCANTSNVAFDTEGRMWWSCDHLFKYDLNWIDKNLYNEIYIPFMYLTAEERLSMSKPAEDPSQLVIPHEVRAGGSQPSRFDRILAMRSPGHENYLVHTMFWWINHEEEACMIFDHNGTPDDISDDRNVLLNDMVDEEGKKVEAGLEYAIYEDLHKGELWLCTLNGVYAINPSDALDGSKVMHRIRISRRDGANVNEYPLDQIAVNSICDDMYDRKWLATESGIYCLSPDSEELLAHFTTENAPLPSNVIYGVGCDMESGAVFFGTEYGIVEFQPEGMGTTPVVAPLTVWPREITPDYHGYLNVSGASSIKDYAIFDSKGEKVCDLGRPTGTMFQIRLTGNEGLNLEPGRYNVRAIGEDEERNIFIMM